MTDNTESTQLQTILKPAREVAIHEAVKAESGRKASKAPGVNITLTAAVADTAGNRVAVVATVLGQVIADAVSLAMLNGGDSFRELGSLMQQSVKIANAECTRVMNEEASPELKQLWGDQMREEAKRQTRDKG